jgi:hypothetical protein
LFIDVIGVATNACGEPDFALVRVETTQRAIDAGEHYDDARDQLGDEGYDEPYVLFDERDCQRFPWFMENVQKYLGVK